MLRNSVGSPLIYANTANQVNSTDGHTTITISKIISIGGWTTPLRSVTSSIGIRLMVREISHCHKASCSQLIENPIALMSMVGYSESKD